MEQGVQIVERPIRLWPHEVRAILEGRKTQTRRVVLYSRQQPPKWATWVNHIQQPNMSFQWVDSNLFQWSEEQTPGKPLKKLRRWPCGPVKVSRNFSQEMDFAIPCPYGKPGDRLWVRETFNTDWADHQILYKADGGSAIEAGYTREPIWKPSIHMPRWASRLTLEIVKVRVERVQAISEEDVELEGIDESLFRSLLKRGNRFNVVPEHWIHGDDESRSFCESCCRKEIARLTKLNPERELMLDGGWDTEGDGQPFCETCHRALSNTFTDYCSEEEISHFEGKGFDIFSSADCYSAQRIIGSQLWKGGKLSTQIHKLAFRALWDSINSKRGHGWDKNPWVWVIEAKRVAPISTKGQSA